VQLKAKVCLVAGASGAIGGAVARRFYEEGAQLAVGYLSREPSLEDKKILRFPLNIRDWSAVQKRVEEVERQFTGIDVLVNCTGVLGPVGPVSETEAEAWVDAVETNLIGSFNLTRAVLPSMLKRQSGKIIHFSGGGAAYARPFFTAYGASKAALVRFTESLAEELRGTNVDVNTIAPGPVNSRMWDQMRAAGSAAGERTREEIRKMEQDGGVSPDRAASLAVFLASERSNGLTGRLISAVHDPWEGFERRIPAIMNSEAGTLRRVPIG
jgi:3-oxoacyl-[acyl-carrier protein] reductase